MILMWASAIGNVATAHVSKGTDCDFFAISTRPLLYAPIALSSVIRQYVLCGKRRAPTPPRGAVPFAFFITFSTLPCSSVHQESPVRREAGARYKPGTMEYFTLVLHACWPTSWTFQPFPTCQIAAFSCTWWQPVSTSTARPYVAAIIFYGKLGIYIMLMRSVPDEIYPFLGDCFDLCGMRHDPNLSVNRPDLLSCLLDFVACVGQTCRSPGRWSRAFSTWNQASKNQAATWVYSRLQEIKWNSS